MRTLYDVLGARPNDDAEQLRNAFRKAVKANHPDHRDGDADAAERLRQIVGAYAILRNPEQRADYDQLLRLERERRRWNAKRIISDLMRNVAIDAIAIVGLTITLAGGYVLFLHVSKVPVQAVESIDPAADEQVAAAAVQPAEPNDGRAGGEPRDGLEHRDVAGTAIAPSVAESTNGGAPEIANDAPAPSLPESRVEVADAPTAPSPPASPNGHALAMINEATAPSLPEPRTEVADTASAPSMPASPNGHAPAITNEATAPSLPEPRAEVADTATAPSVPASPNGHALAITNEAVAPSLPEPRAEVADTATAPSVPASPNGHALEVTKEAAAPSLPEPRAEVAAVVDGVIAPADQAATKPTEAQGERSEASAPPDQGKAESIGEQVPFRRKGEIVPKLSSSEPVIVFQSKTPKQLDIKLTGKPRLAAKRPATGHTAVKQAALENKSTPNCADSRFCTGHMPPLFGVGF